jgi:hypothetical protein
MKRNLMIIPLIFLIYCIYLCWPLPGSGTDIREIEKRNGFVIEIQQGPRVIQENEEWSDLSAGAFTLKIDLLKITPTKILQIKSDTIKARNNVPVEYKFGFRPSPSAEIVSFTLKILPILIKEEPLQIQFKINLFQGIEELQEKVVLIGENESVMVELLENKTTASKLAFRLTPYLKPLDVKGAPYLEKIYAAEKQFFQEPSPHQVAVDVKLIPIFAVDDDGSPVYDLKKQDLEFYVNGKPTEILHLKPYDFGKAGKGKKGKEMLQKEPDRVIIIIVDQVFNGWKGIRRAKEIAAGIVKKASAGDFFIILTNTPSGGLRYIAGPDNNTKKLLAKIDSLQQLPSQRLDNLYSSLGLPDVNDIQSGRTSEVDVIMNRDWNRETSRDVFGLTGEPGIIAEKLQYNADVQRLSYALSQFKYALRTIEKPKIVFLVSRGAARRSFTKSFDAKDLTQQVSFDIFLFNYFKTISKAVNEGGSVLYTVNSQKIIESIDRGESGEVSLEEMARGSGGEYFSGTDPVELANQLTRTLSAYYELVFTPEKEMGQGMQITIKCKRPGINVHSVKHSEIERPYHTMSTVQKKLFALNVVNGGNWSRMVAKIEKAKFKNIKKEKTGDNIIYTKLVKLPESLKNHEVDIFSIQKDPETQKARIDISSKKAAGTLKIKIKGRKHQELFYVIIEPKYVHCIYNQVQ